MAPVAGLTVGRHVIEQQVEQFNRLFFWFIYLFVVAVRLALLFVSFIFYCLYLEIMTMVTQIFAHRSCVIYIIHAYCKRQNNQEIRLRMTSQPLVRFDDGSRRPCVCVSVLYVVTIRHSIIFYIII